jgi:anti-sigma factor RsiW
MHDALNNRLSEYLDNELNARERQELESHLRTCEVCQRDLEGLRAVVARAATLADAPPRAELWNGISSRIGTAEAVPAAVPPARRFTFTLPQLVAASLALMVLSGSMVWLARLGGERTDFPPVAAEPVVPVNFADGAYDDAIADLQRTLDAGRSSLDQETVRILEENLQAIDRAIAQCRSALADDPANVYLNEHLVAARARKLDLLRHAAAIVGPRS